MTNRNLNADQFPSHWVDPDSGERVPLTPMPVSSLISRVQAGTHEDPITHGYIKDMKSGEWDWSRGSEPITVSTFDHDEPFLDDGSHRVVAAHEAGLSHVPVERVHRGEREAGR